MNQRCHSWSLSESHLSQLPNMIWVQVLASQSRLVYDMHIVTTIRISPAWRTRPVMKPLHVLLLQFLDTVRSKDIVWHLKSTLTQHQIHLEHIVKTTSTKLVCNTKKLVGWEPLFENFEVDFGHHPVVQFFGQLEVGRFRVLLVKRFLGAVGAEREQVHVEVYALKVVGLEQGHVDFGAQPEQVVQILSFPNWFLLNSTLFNFLKISDNP